jgi:hypothetical protein
MSSEAGNASRARYLSPNCQSVVSCSSERIISQTAFSVNNYFSVILTKPRPMGIVIPLRLICVLRRRQWMR